MLAISAAIALAVSAQSVLPAVAMHASTGQRIVANDNRVPAGTLRNGVLTVALEIRSGRWYPDGETGPHEEVHAFAEPGAALSIPGPLLRVPEGTEIHASIRNTLDSTLILYGMNTRPGSLADTAQIAPGSTRELRFRAGAAGTYYYWGSTTGVMFEKRAWLDSQLSGALVVDPAGGRTDDRIFVLGMWIKPPPADSMASRPYSDLMVINGRMWPHTAAAVRRWRFGAVAMDKCL